MVSLRIAPTEGEILHFFCKQSCILPTLHPSDRKNLENYAKNTGNIDLVSVRRLVLENCLRKPLRDICGEETAKVLEEKLELILFSSIASIYQGAFPSIILPTSKKLFFTEYFAPFAAHVFNDDALSDNGTSTATFLGVDRPFEGWVKLMATELKVSEKQIKMAVGDALQVNERTMQNWMAGESIGKISYQALQQANIAGRKFSDRHLACLLLVVVAQNSKPYAKQAFQALPQEEEGFVNQLLDKLRTSLHVTSQDFIESHPQVSKWVEMITQLHTFMQGGAGHDKCRKYLKVCNKFFNEHIQQYDIAVSPVLALCDAIMLYREKKYPAALQAYAELLNSLCWSGQQEFDSVLENTLQLSAGLGDWVQFKRAWSYGVISKKLMGMPEEPRIQDMQSYASSCSEDIRNYAKRSRKYPIEDITPLLFFGLKKNLPTQKEISGKGAPTQLHDIPPMSFLLAQVMQGKQSPKVLLPPHSSIQTHEKLRFTPLMVQAFKGGTEGIRILLDAGHDVSAIVPESQYSTLYIALHRAWWFREFEVVNMLLDAKPNRESLLAMAGTTYRNNCLDMALLTGSYSLVERVISCIGTADVKVSESSMDKNIRQLSLHKALQLFAYRTKAPFAHLSIHPDSSRNFLPTNFELYMKLLSSSQALAHRDLLMKDPVCSAFLAGEVNLFYPPFNSQSKGEMLDIIKLLLKDVSVDKEYSPNPYHEGQTFTPLLFAAQIGDEDLFELLLASGACPSGKVGQTGESVQLLAQEYGNTHLLEILARYAKDDSLIFC